VGHNRHHAVPKLNLLAHFEMAYIKHNKWGGNEWGSHHVAVHKLPSSAVQPGKV